MMKFLFVLLLMFSTSAVFAKNKVNWLTFDEAMEASKKEQKKIFIDVYTDWCGWCKVMDKDTFTDTAIVKILNEKYYPVKLNAESKETYSFMNHEFKFKPEYKANELAVALLQGQMSYPSVVFLDEETRLITAVPGAQKPDSLKPILMFFHEEHYKRTPWETYLKQYSDSISNKNAKTTK